MIKQLGCLAIAFLIVITAIVAITVSEQNASTSYFEKFPIKISGKIISKKMLINESGILKIENIKSNFYNYDIRNQHVAYFCVIKGSQAELILSGLRDIKVGDSVAVNSDKMIILYYRNGKKIIENELYLAQPATDPMWNEIIALHTL